MSADNARRVLAAHGSRVFVFQAAGMGFRFAAACLAARLFGPALYGGWSFAFAAAALFVCLATLGLDSVLVKYLPGLPDDGRAAPLIARSISAVLLAGMAAGGTAYLAAGWLAPLLGIDGPGVLFLRFAFMLVPVTALVQVLKGVFQGTGRTPSFFGVDQVLVPFLYLAGVVVIYVRNASCIYVLPVYGVTLVLGAAILMFLLRGRLGRAAAAAEHGPEGIRAFALTSLGLALTAFFTQYSDQLMLGVMAPPAELGLYAAGMRAAVFVLFWLQLAGHVVPPLMAGLAARNDMAGLTGLLRTATRWVSFGAALTAGFIGLARRDLVALFGIDYSGAAAVLGILTLAYLAESSTGPVGHALRVGGRHKALAVNRAGLLVLNIALNAFFIPRWGAVGAAYATLISVVFFNLVKIGQLYAWQRVVPFTPAGAAVILFGLAEFVLGGYAERFLRFGTVINLLLCIMAQAGIGLMALALFIRPEDRALLSAPQPRDREADR